MKVKIRTSDIRISMPIPIRMIGFVVKLIPDIVFDDIKHYIPEPYNVLFTKDVISVLLNECIDILKENKGLEMLHVEAVDGTFISIRL